MISSLSKSAAQGPLYYFSERLIWLQDDKHAIISDVYGQNKAKLNSSFMNNVHTIAVVDPNLEIIPGEKFYLYFYFLIHFSMLLTLILYDRWK